MRKLILICSALFIAAVSQAQIEKGDVQLGGLVSFRSNENGDLDQSSFAFAPQAGLFVSNTTSVGLLLGFNSNKFPALNTNSGQFEDVTSQIFSFGVYARFHKSLADNFYLFLQPAIQFGSGTVEQVNSGDVDTNTFSIAAAPGITYFLSPKFALEMRLGNIGYASNKAELNGTENKSSGFNFDVNLANVGLGLNFYIK